MDKLDFKKTIKSEKTIISIINNTYERLKCKPTDILTKKIVKYIKNDVDIDYIHSKSKGDINKATALIEDGFHQFITYESDKNKEYDYATYQYNLMASSKGDSTATDNYTSSSKLPEKVVSVNPTIMSVSNSASIDTSSQSLYNYAKILNINSVYRKTHVLIDTRYKNLSINNKSEFSFNLVDSNVNLRQGSGDLYIGGKNIKNISSIEVCPFNIPYVASADNFYKKLTLSFAEFKNDAFGAYENSSFHYMLSYTKNGLLMNLTPDNKVYEFKYPINPKTLTIKFGDPLTPIYFDEDRMIVSSIDYNSNSGRLIFTDRHNLSSSDIIYISGFATNNDITNTSIVNNINRKEGHNVTVEDLYTISINVDFTTIVSPNTSNKPLVYFGSKRIIIPLIINYIADLSNL